jgi:hypothetical protein
MDNGIGIDFVSLSQPPLHTVPLFLVQNELNEGSSLFNRRDFYEIPYWMSVTFVDCAIDSSATLKLPSRLIKKDKNLSKGGGRGKERGDHNKFDLTGLSPLDAFERDFKPIPFSYTVSCHILRQLNQHQYHYTTDNNDDDNNASTNALWVIRKLPLCLRLLLYGVQLFSEVGTNTNTQSIVKLLDAVEYTQLQSQNSKFSIPMWGAVDIPRLVQHHTTMVASTATVSGSVGADEDRKREAEESDDTNNNTNSHNVLETGTEIKSSPVMRAQFLTGGTNIIPSTLPILPDRKGRIMRQRDKGRRTDSSLRSRMSMNATHHQKSSNSIEMQLNMNAKSSLPMKSSHTGLSTSQNADPRHGQSALAVSMNSMNSEDSDTISDVANSIAQSTESDVANMSAYIPGTSLSRENQIQSYHEQKGGIQDDFSEALNDICDVYDRAVKGLVSSSTPVSSMSLAAGVGVGPASPSRSASASTPVSASTLPLPPSIGELAPYLVQQFKDRMSEYDRHAAASYTLGKRGIGAAIATTRSRQEGATSTEPFRSNRLATSSSPQYNGIRDIRGSSSGSGSGSVETDSNFNDNVLFLRRGRSSSITDEVTNSNSNSNPSHSSYLPHVERGQSSSHGSGSPSSMSVDVRTKMAVRSPSKLVNQREREWKRDKDRGRGRGVSLLSSALALDKDTKMRINRDRDKADYDGIPSSASYANPNVNIAMRTNSNSNFKSLLSSALAKDSLSRGVMMPGSPSSLGNVRTISRMSGDTTISRERNLENYLGAYERKYAINPFKRHQGGRFLTSRSHNRRRWSHVFPQGVLERNISRYFGMNWKSLTQPAMLPLNTDYVPSEDSLASTYTRSTYNLILDPKECAWKSIDSLLIEMVCQRLTQEFQLVENVDLSHYRRYISGRHNVAPPKTIRQNFSQLNLSTPEHSISIPKSNGGIGMGMGVLESGARIGSNTSLDRSNHSNLDRSTHSIMPIKSEDGDKDRDNQDRFYVLSMGHRIHIIAFDSNKREFTVNRFTSEVGTNGAEENRVTYTYDVWVPQMNSFQVLSQTFYRFPHPEFNWNLLDEILLGNRDDLAENLKSKRIRFALVPPLSACTSREEEEAYFIKFENVLQLLENYCEKNDKILMERDYLWGSDGRRIDVDSVDLNDSENSKRRIKRNTKKTKLWLQKPTEKEKDGNHNDDVQKREALRNRNEIDPKWVYLIYDSSVKTSRIIHFSLQWVVCDSWILDDFMNVLFRRCSTWGLRLAQIPEYFCTSNLNIHPFRPNPFLYVPQLDKAYQEMYKYLSATRVVERLFFNNEHEPSKDLWVQDHDHSTDWEGIAQETTTHAYTATALGQGDHSTDDTSFHTQTNGPWKPSSRYPQIKPKDTQYFHRMCLASVRVGMHGFVWLMNSTARVSDLLLRDDQKINAAYSQMTDFSRFCESAGVCYGLVVEIIEKDFFAMDFFKAMEEGERNRKAYDHAKVSSSATMATADDDDDIGVYRANNMRNSYGSLKDKEDKLWGYSEKNQGNPNVGDALK